MYNEPESLKTSIMSVQKYKYKKEVVIQLSSY